MKQLEANATKIMTEETKMIYDVKKLFEENIIRHEDKLLKASGERKRLEQFTEEEKVNQQDKKCQLEVLEKELNQLLQEMESKEEENKLALESLDNIVSDKEAMKEKIETSEKQANACLKDLQNMEEIFQERLGLKFVKTADQRLQVIFTNIDPKDPSAAFSFAVKVLNGKYEVSNAQPEIENLELLTEKLNKTNSFRSFIITVRKYYCSTVS
ncbi:hypothetical protein SNE40_022755 [Patella caerulea]|uniref:Kinetochore protein SPC25 n=1 Tax=Patella caerulea TaxID=87958 RepID=A0AAN8G8U6_PATCE